MDKKGSMMDLFILIAAGFIIIVVFAIFIYGFGIVNTALANVPNPSPNPLNLSISGAAAVTFGNVNAGLDTLRWISFVMIFAMMLSILISNFLIKAHPLFYGLYILIVIVAIVFSVYVSNAYEGLLTGNGLSDTLNLFTASTFIMLNLPVVISIVGIFGAIFLFINFPKDSGLGGGLS